LDPLIIYQSDYAKKCPVSGTKLCLERSQQKLLSIHLIIGAKVHPGIMHSLIQNANRWQKLDISIDFRPEYSGTSFSSEDCNLVRFLSTVRALPALECFRYDYIGYLPADLSMFDHAPKLCFLEINSDIRSPTINIPWSQLTLPFPPPLPRH